MKTLFSKDYLIKNSGCYINKRKELNEILDKLPDECNLNQLLNVLSVKDFVWFLVYKTEMKTKDRLANIIYLTNLAIQMYPGSIILKEEYDRLTTWNSETDDFIFGGVATIAGLITILNLTECNTDEFRNKVRELI